MAQVVNNIHSSTLARLGLVELLISDSVRQ